MMSQNQIHSGVEQIPLLDFFVSGYQFKQCPFSFSLFYHPTLQLPQRKMISNVLARSAMRASSRQVVRSDLYHFSNSNGQVNRIAI
jgi:hypothetical protein